MKKYLIHISPCPNDTYIFDAMLNNKIDTEGIKFNYVLEDIEKLNKSSLNNIPDICKISYHTYIYISHNYNILTSGSALGHNVGPILISKKTIKNEEINNIKIAIPGNYTTANLLLKLAYGNNLNTQEFLFSKIEDAIIKNKVDAGVIIHENRFTFEQKGLKKIVDLGEFWFNKTSLPIPLGGIVIKKNIALETQKTINRIIKRSIEYALNSDSISDFVINNSQEMEKEIVNKHIGLYVNNFSENLDENGQKAILMLFEEAYKKNLINKYEKPTFVE